jgi:flagellar basal-body rod modification protein FlgD
VSTTSDIPSIGQDAQTAAAAQTAATAGTGATKTTATGLGLDKDAFLKILVEQLRHQDPSQPGDSQQYIQQMTQFSMLEQLTNISQAVQVQHADTAASSAMSLVGRTISWTDGDQTRSGVVDRVSFGDGGPTLTAGATTGITLSSITEVA